MDEPNDTTQRMTSLQLGSWWMYLQDDPDGAVTIFQVRGTHATGGSGSVSVIDVWYYSLNGTTNNADYTRRDIPSEIKPLTSTSFIGLVKTGRLVPIQTGSMLILTAEPVAKN